MRLPLIFCLLLLSSLLTGQVSDVWATLTKVTSRQAYNPELGYVNLDIEVSDEVMELDGELIEVDGYIIPLTGQVGQNNFMFSMYPKNMCFFCGAAGPESAMEVWMEGDNTVPFTSDKIKLKGKLLINKDDTSGLIYSLNSATRIK